MTSTMKVHLSFLLLLLIHIKWSSSEHLDFASYGCGFNDSDLLLGGITRSPHSTGQWFRWDEGKIPYYFKGNVKDGDKALARDIMDEIEAHTCFKYIHHDSEPAGHHLEIVVESPSCYRNGFGAYVQPQAPYPYKKVLLYSSKQLTDHESCDNRGGLMHEMMHALGVGHTQKRADRDQYVTLNEANIQRMSQYSICENCRTYKEVPYDCNSIMHYGQGTFSIGQGYPTMEARNPQTCKLSWRGPAFDVGKPALSDWKLLEIIAGQVCDMKAARWLSWSDWSACSQPCGDGRRSRKRSCLVPGKCEGESKQEIKCSLKDLKEPQKCSSWKSFCKDEKWKDWMQKQCGRTCNCGDGSVSTWSTWGDWSSCSASCGDGTKIRKRTCSIEGKCPGESQQTNKCDLPKCVAASWTAWSEWSSCSASCGDGTKTRKRTCSIEGKCPGDNHQTNKCDLPKCAGTWSSWGDWSGCSASCGDGIKTRKRTCSISEKCPGDSKQTNACHLQKCDEDICQTSNGACILPFTYHGNTYNGCTKDGWDRAWCQTQENGSGQWWGVCSKQCKMHKEDTAATDCKTITGYNCVFPFFYEGMEYKSCTTDGPFGGRKWCAIRVDDRKQFIDGYWGYCENNCS